MTTNRFYWIKLRTNFFSREDIDFLLSQKNGAEYVVLYQMLCLNTANNQGRLETKMGEIIIPYNAEKIVRDCKYFDIDTVNVAMSLYKKLGIIYEEEDRVLKISNYDEMVGSEAGNSNAQRQKRFRERQKQLKLNVTNSNDVNNESNITINNEEYRDKSIEYRDKILDIDKEIELDENNVYSKDTTCIRENNIENIEILKNTGVSDMYTDCIHSIDKNSIDENRIDDNHQTDLVVSSTDSKTNYETEFEILWKYYPNKKGKDQAKNKYILARKKGTTYETIANGLKKYITYIKAEKIEEKFIKHGSTWFNQNCWNDEYKISNKKDNQMEILKGVYDGTIKVN